MLWTIEQTKTAVNAALQTFFEDKKAAAKRLDDDYFRLWDVTGSFVLSGGKRLRPHLCILAYQAFGGQDPVSIVPVAAAQELLHLCLLIHDDIIDRDYMRYGVANVTGNYRSIYSTYSKNKSQKHQASNNIGHLADGAAILSGDLLLSEAYGLISDSGLLDWQIKLAQQQLRHAMFFVAGGELLDSEAVLKPITNVDINKIMQLKTAEYSCMAPLLTGALLAGEKPENLADLNNFGQNLGIAYQLMDDLLGVFGKEAAIGKSTSSDIQEKKRTLLVKETLGNASVKDHEFILSVYQSSDDLTPNKATVKKIKEIMQESGAVTIIEKAIQAHLQAALSALQKTSMSDESKTSITQLAQKVVDGQQRSVHAYDGK